MGERTFKPKYSLSPWLVLAFDILMLGLYFLPDLSSGTDKYLADVLMAALVVYTGVYLKLASKLKQISVTDEITFEFYMGKVKRLPLGCVVVVGKDIVRFEGVPIFLTEIQNRNDLSISISEWSGRGFLHTKTKDLRKEKVSPLEKAAGAAFVGALVLSALVIIGYSFFYGSMPVHFYGKSSDFCMVIILSFALNALTVRFKAKARSLRQQAEWENE